MVKVKHIMVMACMAIATSCNDDSLNIGNTLTANSDKINAASATYNAQSRTLIVDSVLSKSTTCFFGRIMDPETGISVTSEFMTQFYIQESFALHPDSQIVNRENGMAVADSCQIELYFNKPSSACDTLAPMKLRLHELDRPLDEGRVYYSNYDLVENGYLRKGGLTTDKMFTYADQALYKLRKQSTEDESYGDFIQIPLNKPYTDRQGVTYKNYGTFLIQQYQQHPEYFKNAYQMIHHICPGFFFQIIDGYGFYSQVPVIALRFFYTVSVNDSVYSVNKAFAGTEEVLQTTKIGNDNEAIRRMAADNSCTYIKSPAGLFTEVTLPVNDIISGHENDSLLAAKISFQRINNATQNEHALDVPTYLLMLPKDSLYTFFEHNSLTDNKISFYTTYSSSTNTYTFNNISSLITFLNYKRNTGRSADPYWEERHPDWNKVLLVPISLTNVTVNSSVQTTDVSHNMGITSTRLVGGSNNPHSPIQVSVVYGQFRK